MIRYCVEREYIEDASAFLGYKVRIIREWQEQVEFHGDIVFYTSNIKSSSGGQYSLRADTGDDPLDFEYKTRFTEGKLQWIRALHKPIAQQIKAG